MQFLKKISRLAVTIALTLVPAWVAYAQNEFTLSGEITAKDNGEPVEFATIVIEGTGQWAVTDNKGQFTIKNVPSGKQIVVVNCLGYVEDKREITLNKEIFYKIGLKEDNLALEEAVVTAKEDNGTTTTRTINKAALEQVQVMNVGNLSSLLPGGATVNSNLTSEESFNLRAGSGSEDGNPAFGTAVEIDGIRLSNNASFSKIRLTDSPSFNDTKTNSTLKGVSTNNIASTNIASVEVITGVPSVEYGDMTSGVVKINTVKGKTPWMLTFSTNPSTKQVSASKGFGLGNTGRGVSRGVLNASAEYAVSYGNKLSPYNAYDRKQVMLTYSNLFANGLLAEMPLRLTAGFTGNLGGYNDKSDPDKFLEEYAKAKENGVRGNISLDWLLNRKWITNLEFNASVIYSDKYQEAQTHYSKAVSSLGLHGTENGYFLSDYYKEGGNTDVVLMKPGYWNNIMAVDDKPFTAKVSLKGNWSRKFGTINNKLKIGAEWTADKNFGIGVYNFNIGTAPTFREYKYCDKPLMSNVAAYIEENLMIPTGKDGRVNLVAGLRSDNAIIPGSVYGTTPALSPRFNAKYTVFTEKTHRSNVVKSLSFRGSWGLATKLPSYSILYPEPSYLDIETFRSTADSQNNVYYAYKIIPNTIEYNANLRLQRSQQSEIGTEINIGGTSISLVGFYSRTENAYKIVSDYDRLSYNLIGNVQGIDIPVDNRTYSIDRNTGIVTIGDKSGALPSVTAPYTTKNRFISRYYADNNDSPSHRYGLEWVIDFTRIEPINTTIRLDGTYYRYKSVYSDIMPYYPVGTSADGSLYKYVGIFYGGKDQSNSSATRNLKTNLTVTTNIPKARMIIAVRLEACLLRQTEYRSERLDGASRTYAISNRNDYLSFSNDDIYKDDTYSVTFPDSYYSFGDDTRRPFLEDFKNERALYDQEVASGIQNGPHGQKYSDMCKLVTASTTYSYFYHTDNLSPYFSMNISVTKEIGKWASISFYANNFFNNVNQIYSSRNGQWTSSSTYIPAFYYGLTLRLKF